uniref:ZP domain-containing protein n=1 Tax=Steinernema glaseri TaxID=37863 RepID=A0A1I8AD15_9BILA
MVVTPKVCAPTGNVADKEDDIVRDQFYSVLNVKMVTVRELPTHSCATFNLQFMVCTYTTRHLGAEPSVWTPIKVIRANRTSDRDDLFFSVSLVIGDAIGK